MQPNHDSHFKPRFLKHRLRTLAPVAALALLTIPAYADTSPWDNAVNVLKTAFTGTIAHRAVTGRHCRRRSHVRLRRRPIETDARRDRLRRRHGDRRGEFHGLVVSRRRSDGRPQPQHKRRSIGREERCMAEGGHGRTRFIKR